MARHVEAGALKPPKAVSQHRPVGLAEDVAADLGRQVGSDPQDEPVEGGVVQLAERQPVGDDGSALRVPVREDVRRVSRVT
ncbi:MAG: hypothetical protein L0Z62_14505 [Gemmataceae bacterium]|nr:hypothetical protein [Gemmataceae bacterium]